ncbi:MAG: hypothetical protein B7733_01255 [Myxococcales bacterium FL481]|nr:MAG: hypothetical protein B7733_01255 [Myxococcales bacterium FL481]
MSATAGAGHFDFQLGSSYSTVEGDAVSFAPKVAAMLAANYFTAVPSRPRTQLGAGGLYLSSIGLAAELHDAVGPAVQRPARWHRFDASFAALQEVGQRGALTLYAELGYSRVALFSPVQLPAENIARHGPLLSVGMRALVLKRRVRLGVAPQARWLWLTEPRPEGDTSPLDRGSLTEIGATADITVRLASAFGLGVRGQHLYGVSASTEYGHRSRAVMAFFTFDSNLER